MRRRQEIEEHIKIYTALVAQQQEFITTLESLQQLMKNEDFSEQIATFRTLAEKNSAILKRFDDELKNLKDSDGDHP